MPKVRIIKNVKAGRTVKYGRGHGIPVQSWKGVYEELQREQDQLALLINNKYNRK